MSLPTITKNISLGTILSLVTILTSLAFAWSHLFEVRGRGLQLMRSLCLGMMFCCHRRLCPLGLGGSVFLRWGNGHCACLQPAAVERALAVGAALMVKAAGGAVRCKSRRQQSSLSDLGHLCGAASRSGDCSWSDLQLLSIGCDIKVSGGEAA